MTVYPYSGDPAKMYDLSRSNVEVEPQADQSSIPVQQYTVEATVRFSIKATSVSSAYKTFEEWMVNAFNASFAESQHPNVAPCYYEGISVAKVEPQ